MLSSKKKVLRVIQIVLKIYQTIQLRSIPKTKVKTRAIFLPISISPKKHLKNLTFILTTHQ